MSRTMKNKGRKKPSSLCVSLSVVSLVNQEQLEYLVVVEHAPRHIE